MTASESIPAGFTLIIIGDEDAAAGTPIPPRPTPAERIDQRDRERDARVTGMPVRPAPRRFGDNPDDFIITPDVLTRQPARRRSRSCNHGGGQS